MLYRAIYIRDGKPRGITFAYDSPEGAAAFAERFVTSLKRYYRDATLLTVTFARQVGEPRRRAIPQAQRELT